VQPCPLLNLPTCEVCRLGPAKSLRCQVLDELTNELPIVHHNPHLMGTPVEMRLPEQNVILYVPAAAPIRKIKGDKGLISMAMNKHSDKWGIRAAGPDQTPHTAASMSRRRGIDGGEGAEVMKVLLRHNPLGSISYSNVSSASQKWKSEQCLRRGLASLSTKKLQAQGRKVSMPILGG
jgi:hypothetical protein